MTNQEIKTVGQTIAQETQIGGNTAARVGGVVEGIGVALDNKDAANGYYQATISGGTITVNAPNYLLGSGGNLRIKMPSAGTGASTLTIGNANAVQLWYNGAAVSAQNTWEANEIISVFYDGTRFMASNSQGGGNNERTPYYIAKMVNGVYTVAVADNPSASHFKLDKGGVVRIRMPLVGTGASQLQIGNTDVKDLLYNGQAVSPTNTWGLHEIISVYYDGTQYQSCNSENWSKADILMCKVKSTIDITASTTSTQQKFFNNTNIGFVKGKKYRIQTFTSTTHADDVRFFLRDVASSETVSFNLDVSIPIGSIMSEQVIYECRDDSAQYVSMWTANKKAASYKIRIEEIDVVDNLEGVCFSQVVPMIVSGSINSDGSFADITTRIRTDFIKVDGEFILSLNSGYFFNVQYYNESKTWVKAANYSYWLKDGWKDSWNGYIAVAIRNYANNTINPTDAHGFSLKCAIKQTLPLYNETYPLEYGSINAGVDIKSTTSCRTPFNSFIPIADGETIECQFHLAQAKGGIYGAYYKYFNGKYIGGNGYAIVINNGTVVSITNDGTFNEVRFRVAGTTTWTKALAEASFVSVTRNAKKVAAYNEDLVRGLVHGTYLYSGEITLGRKFRLKKLWQIAAPTTTTQASCAWNGYLILGDSTTTWRVLNMSDGSVVGTISVPVSCHTNTLQFAPTLHNGNTQFPYLYASQWDSPSSFFVFELTMSGSTFTLTLVQTYDTSGLDKNIFGYLNDFAIDFENNYLYSIGYATNNYEDTNWLYCKFPFTPVSGGNVTLVDSNIIEHWSIANGYKFRHDNLFDNGKIYSIVGIFDYHDGHNWMFALDVYTHKKSALLDLAQFTQTDEEPEGLFMHDGEAYFMSHRSEGYIELYKMIF